MTRLRQTPSQTVGPFFAYSLTAEQYGYPYNSIVTHALVSGQTPDAYPGAERLTITGRVFDGNGASIADALIELWQADPAGHYRTTPIERAVDDTYFTGFGRVGTGTHRDHRFTFSTLRPGRVREGQALSAPHINVLLFMRGSLRGLYTRIYFADEAEANEQDALLARVPVERRSTLLAQRRDTSGQVVYTFDIHMQGRHETVFFDL